MPTAYGQQKPDFGAWENFYNGIGAAKMHALALVLVAVLGAIWGGLAAPAAAARVLTFKHEQSVKRFMTNLHTWQDRRAKAGDDWSPKVSDPGTDGALAIWRRDMARQHKNGTLVLERQDALLDAGVLEPPRKENLQTESEFAAKYERPAKPWFRAVWAAVSAATLASLTAPEVAPATFAAAAALVAVLAISAYTDSAAMLIPVELAAATLLLSFLYTLSAHGLHGVLAGLLALLAVWVSVKVLDAVCSLLHLPDPMGRGDARLLCALAPAFAVQGALAAVFFTFFTPAVTVLLARLLGKRESLKGRVAMAPYMAFGAMAGLMAVHGPSAWMMLTG